MLSRGRAVILVLALAGAIVVGLLGPISAVSAHTELVHWEFVGGTPEKPERLLLRFSEPIDARFLTVSILGGGGESQLTPTIDPQHRTDGLVDISALSPGAYSVAWWTRARDGDPSNGSFLIGIGSQVSPTALLPPVGARDPAIQPAMFYGDTAWDTILHWLIYLGAALLLGSVGFGLLIWRPAVRKKAGAAPAGDAGVGTDSADCEKLGRLEAVAGIDGRMTRVLRSLAVAGAALFLFANLLLFVMQVEFIRYSILQPVTGSAPTPLGPSVLSHEAPYKSAADIFRGYNGAVWITRMVLAVIVLVLSSRLTSSAATGRRRRWVVTLAAGLAMLATVSLTAHAAVVPQSSFAVVLDWTHLTAMCLWLGGLLPLLIALRQSRRESGTAAGPEAAGSDLRRAVVRRFSTMALIAVAWLAATGLFAAYLHVGSPSLLIPTTYGRALIAKLVLFAALVALGALHRRVSIPRLDRESRVGTPLIERVLPIEIAVGSLLLAAVALMISLGTSAAVWPAHQALGLASPATTGQVTVTFRAVPGRAGENAIALDVADRRSGPPTTIDNVTLEIDGRTVVLTPAGKLVPGSVQRFVSNDLVELSEGKSTIAYAVTRPSYPEARGTIVIDVPPALLPSGSARNPATRPGDAGPRLARLGGALQVDRAGLERATRALSVGTRT